MTKVKGSYRAGSIKDKCPGCGFIGVLFAADVKKFGEHKLRVCDQCRKVFLDGKEVGKLEDG